LPRWLPASCAALAFGAAVWLLRDAEGLMFFGGLSLAYLVHDVMRGGVASPVRDRGLGTLRQGQRHG